MTVVAIHKSTTINCISAVHIHLAYILYILYMSVIYHAGECQGCKWCADSSGDKTWVQGPARTSQTGKSPQLDFGNVLSSKAFQLAWDWNKVPWTNWTQRRSEHLCLIWGKWMNMTAVLKELVWSTQTKCNCERRNWKILCFISSVLGES